MNYADFVALLQRMFGRDWEARPEELRRIYQAAKRIQGRQATRRRGQG